MENIAEKSNFTRDKTWYKRRVPYLETDGNCFIFIPAPKSDESVIVVEAFANKLAPQTVHTALFGGIRGRGSTTETVGSGIKHHGVEAADYVNYWTAFNKNLNSRISDDASLYGNWVTCTYKKSGTTLAVDGQVVATSSKYGLIPNDPWGLFGVARLYNGATDFQYLAEAGTRIRKYQELDGDNQLVVDMIPVVTFDGQLAMYDKVTGISYTNDGTGSFSCGEEEGED